MITSFSSLTPDVAWPPLPAHEWNESAARHLLQRVGFSSSTAEFETVLREGPTAALKRYFSAMPAWEKPQRVRSLEKHLAAETDGKTPRSAAERREAARDLRERSRLALQDMILGWLEMAATPANSPAEKWMLFLSDVWVVSVEKVKNTATVFQHLETLRAHALGPAPALAKAMSRSPAMIVYLDLQQSRRSAPNENFARELFELFVLGEGHYSESDIKEAARAFTGYRQRRGEFLFARKQHDGGRKTVFGKQGDFDGDAIIDLAFRQPAAATFLPSELIRFYLSDTPLPRPHVEALGKKWAESGFGLRELATLFFSSRAFYAPEFRGGMIKSPVQFYLGLVQDLGLRVAPLPRYVVGPLRQMGQLPFDPPNVRGWVGGRAWINSATLAVRRQIVRQLLQPLNAATLNADEQAALARLAAGNVTVPSEQFSAWANLPDDVLARTLARRVAPAAGDRIERVLAAHLAGDRHSPEGVREILAALLESPAYQLC